MDNAGWSVSKFFSGSLSIKSGTGSPGEAASKVVTGDFCRAGERWGLGTSFQHAPDWRNVDWPGDVNTCSRSAVAAHSSGMIPTALVESASFSNFDKGNFTNKPIVL
jgi:hypothetical protein